MIQLSLVILENRSIFEQLQIEEALLRADNRNWCLLNTGCPPAIVMGISGKPELLVDPNVFAARPLPLIRRFSGGGTVIVDHHTFFATWICNAEQIDVACCPQKIHRWSENFYKAAFPSLRMQLKENDYAIGEKKFGGNAQYLCKGRWLHHTSFLWDYDPAMMKYLLMPQKVPAYRQRRSHEDFLCRLRNHIHEKEHLQSLLVHQAQKSFKVDFIGQDELLSILQKPHRKATHRINGLD